MTDRVHIYEYLSVEEVARLLSKSKDRVYDMANDGLLEDVGWMVLRTKAGRIWIGLPMVADPAPDTAEAQRLRKFFWAD